MQPLATSATAAQTRLFGQALGELLQPGDIVVLSGDLGAGKTQFVQGVAQGLGIADVPISPTFNIVLTYSGGRMPLHHFDLYRLDLKDELDGIGFKEYLESGGVCFIEWADKFPDALDECLALNIAKVSESDRAFSAAAQGMRACSLLEEFKTRLSGDLPEPDDSLAQGSLPEPVGPLAQDSLPERGKALAQDSASSQGSLPATSGPLAQDSASTQGSLPEPDDSLAQGSLPATSGPLAQDCASAHDSASAQGATLNNDYLDKGTAAHANAAKQGDSLPDVAAMHNAHTTSNASAARDVNVARKFAGSEAKTLKREGHKRFVVAFDTANDVIAVGVGSLDVESKSVSCLATREVQAHRSSNTRLLGEIESLLEEAGIKRDTLASVCVGRGPGSFTGVRIAMATAKGIASALGVALVGVSTLDAIAWNAQLGGIRGSLLVVADAMRKEVYPARFDITDKQVVRLGADTVVKADAFAAGLPDATETAITGDALFKYRDLIEGHGTVLPETLWNVTGAGLLKALEAAWQNGTADPLDSKRFAAARSLPVYTRLSDAEEHERIRLAATTPKNLVAGVQDVAPDGERGRATMHASSLAAVHENAAKLIMRPLDGAHAHDVAALEKAAMGTDAWSAKLVADELTQRNRSWWVAQLGNEVVGYAGGMTVDADLQILKVAVSKQWRRRGIARELIVRVADDARNLGASTCSLEVRASNATAQAFYASMGLAPVGIRPRYYSDREDAVIMQGPLPSASKDVAGMELQHIEAAPLAMQKSASQKPGNAARPLILAIESSCDETAAAIVDGQGNLLSDVVASQIDFHARFGGVVPEIASRKHIEAICGVCDEALACASATQGAPLRYNDLNAIAVTYAPGLVGALVVGVAFAKGAAWALNVPFIGVNHLEGHLYANKIGDAGFAPPAVVSLVSGGNTMLVHMRDWGDYRILGETIDDAVGEAFDKVAKALGLGYPGGPAISREAAKGNPAAVDFPRAMMHSHDLRFSLSGLKTAVVNYVNKERQAGRSLNIPDIAASFQQAVIDVQVAKATAALDQTDAPTFCLGGGVAANPALRQAYEDLCERKGCRLVMPPLASCGDNAGMIALVALDRYRQGKFFDLSADAFAHANLEEPY